MELTIRSLDAVTVGVYLLTMLGVGAYFARRNKTTEEYFVGNRAISDWVIGLSMLGTIVSSATFLVLPAAAYVLDWRQLAVNLVLPIAAIVAVVVFIPFFRRGKLTSAFEYLGNRYGPVPRLYGTLSFVMLQLIRMAQILFLVSIPIQFLTGAPIEWVVVGAGLFIAFYTIAGGIEAVIWTVVVQAMILYSSVALPMWAMFFFIGTSLFVYYQTFPDPVVAGLDADQVLPYFILSRIPAGLAGLVVAAVIAAAMSSLDSGINSISTVVVVDLMKPYLAKNRDDGYYLRAARVIAAGVTTVVSRIITPGLGSSLIAPQLADGWTWPREGTAKDSSPAPNFSKS